MMWTTEHIAALRSSWAIGLSSAQIAKALGVTRNAVIGKAWRLGLADRRVMRKARKPRPEHRRVAKPRPAPAPAPCKSVCRPLFDLADDQCRWVVDTEEFLFCGAPIAGERRPYCARHMQESRRR